MRLSFFGMRNEMSRHALQAILANGIEISNLFLPDSEFNGYGERTAVRDIQKPKFTSPIPLINPLVNDDIIQIAWQNGIQIIAVADLEDLEALQVTQAAHHDLVCVACFPQLLPDRILETASAGFFNLHPSLLPDFRGPAPLFWIFRGGDSADFGVTIHLMNDQFDSGDIVAQQSLDLPDGISGFEAQAQVGTLGGKLFSQVISAAADGTLIKRKQPSGGFFNPWPASKDFELQIGWSAKRAFNFMRGTNDWGHAYRLRIDQREVILSNALEYSDSNHINRPVKIEGSRAVVQFAKGTLTADLAHGVGE